ncbi:50S ribosomal protein L2 [Candidatus Gugararchaeum adminiculabundum]|nr:50S ribosomal protein L2 [Candidatus Gugararchaeum adminiculabundum]
MGKRLRPQRRGKGTFAYSAPSHKYKANVRFRKLDELEELNVIGASVMEFIDDPGRSSLLMMLKLDNGEKLMLIAPEGIQVGDRVEIGAGAGVSLGNVLPLSSIPDGAPVFNLELAPGDGGKFVRASGTSATVVSREGANVIIKLPSKRMLTFGAQCRAQLGVVAGGGALEKPLMTAGKSHYKHHAQNRTWPYVRGVAMNAVAHPHGGKQHHVGKGTAVSRNAPPGQKVGHIAARSTGRRKGKKIMNEQE